MGETPYGDEVTCRSPAGVELVVSVGGRWRLIVPGDAIDGRGARSLSTCAADVAAARLLLDGDDAVCRDLHELSIAASEGAAGLVERLAHWTARVDHQPSPRR